jgi:hypothetical protein
MRRAPGSIRPVTHLCLPPARRDRHRKPRAPHGQDRRAGSPSIRTHRALGRRGAGGHRGQICARRLVPEEDGTRTPSGIVSWWPATAPLSPGRRSQATSGDSHSVVAFSPRFTGEQAVLVATIERRGAVSARRRAATVPAPAAPAPAAPTTASWATAHSARRAAYGHPLPVMAFDRAVRLTKSLSMPLSARAAVCFRSGPVGVWPVQRSPGADAKP